MQGKLLISIITPTYNRAHLLRRCYTSLVDQTEKNFEWIIVDDGSKDDTETIVKQFASDDFPVIYIKKENGGKHTALNASHPYVRGQYVLILDSDDYLSNDAVEQIRQYWKKWEDIKKVGILTFLKGNTIDEPLCTGEIADMPVDILRSKRKIIRGNDCCEVIRAELFLKFPFPVFEGEKFLSECALWNRVALTHQCVYINRVIYLCEYLEGGLTKSGRALRIRNPRGGMFISNLRLEKNNYFTQRIKYGLLFDCYGFFAGLPAAKIIQATSTKVLTAVCLLPGYALYHLWRNKHL